MVLHKGRLKAVNRRSVPNVRMIPLWDSARKKIKLCKLYDFPEVVLTLGFSSSTPTPDQDLTLNICKAVGNLVHQG